MAVSYLSQQPFVSSAPIPSIDLNLMASVLQQKQSMFDANFEKAQSQLSTVASLDVLREDDRLYRDNKLNELTKNLNSMNGDFSDPNISSQIDNSISNIYSDSRILNAVSSTKNIRALQAGYQKMQSDPKLAKYYSDANYDADMAEVERYASSKDPNDTYKGKGSPTLFASYMPDLVKAAEKVKGEGWARLENGTDGFYNINTGEVVTAEKISANIMGILDSNQRAQLARDANFLWGKKLNLNPTELVNKINNTTTEKIKNINEYLNNLEISKKSATVEELKTITKTINDYKTQLSNLTTRKLNVEKQYQDYLKNGGSLESLRFMAYEDDIAKTLGNLYSWSKPKIDTKVNPYKVSEYQSILRQNEMAIAQKYKLEQIREAAKYRDNPNNPDNVPPPPVANPDFTELTKENQAAFNNQLATQYENQIQNINTQKPELKSYKSALIALSDGKPAIVPRDADDSILSSDIYSFGAMRLRKANLAPNVEAVWKEQNSLPILENKVDKASLQNIKSNILQNNPTFGSIDNIRLTNIGLSKVQFRKDKNGALIEDNNFYVDVEVKQGNEYVKVAEHPVSPEYAKILSNNALYPESREQMIINRGVDETNHFSTIVQSKANPKAAFKITIAKVDNAYEAFVEYEGKAIPLTALDTNIKRVPFAWTALEAARAYLKNIPSKDAIAAKIKNYIPSAKENLPTISFSNNDLYSSNFSWNNVVNSNQDLIKQRFKENINQPYSGNMQSSISRLPKLNK